MRDMDPAAAAHQQTVVFNLFPYYLGGWYLPNAFIVGMDKDGKPAYILQTALPETIGSYGIELTPDLEKLFSVIEVLSLKNLEEKFSPPKKKPQPLEELINNKEVKSSIEKFIHRQMDVFLSKITAGKYPLAFRAEKKAIIEDLLVRFPEDELTPRFIFRKMKEGIHYRFFFSDSKERWHIRSRTVLPLTNQPGWLLVDGLLYRLPELNGYLVKPFQTKNEIVIPNRLAREYFEKFILKALEKTSIEAEGFEVVSTKKLEGCELVLTKHLFKEAWYVGLKFNYHGVVFSQNDRSSQRITLDMQDEDNIRVLQIKRNPAAEADYLQRLSKLKFKQAEGGLWQLPAGAGEAKEKAKANGALFDAVEWLSQNRPEIEGEGFTIQAADLGEKKLSLLPASWTSSIHEGRDWFDLKIIVRVGDFEFPFSKLVSYIRDGTREFPLPDGTFFIIPAEWLGRFHGLAHLGKEEGGEVRLSKSQRPLLEALDLSGTASLQKKALVDFSPSKFLKAELRPYQTEGAQWLAQHYQDKLGACLADDMGLGKTLQTLAVLLFAKENLVKVPGASQPGLFGETTTSAGFVPLKALVILPASLVFNWEQEVKKFAPQISLCKHTGPHRTNDMRLLQRFDLVLTTYQTASRDLGFLKQIEWEYIVLDESHYIKNPQSGVFKSVGQLRAKHKISLSGTPIENSLSDLWAQMQFLNPGMLGSFPFFKKHFITPIEKQENEARKEELQGLVQPYLKRRTKEEVAPELPELTETVFYSEMSEAQHKLYEREKSAVRNQILKIGELGLPENRIAVLAALMRLRQIACHPALVFPDEKANSGKFDDVLEYWDVVRRSGHKALVFSSFEKHLQLFKAHFEGEKLPFAWLTGDVPASQRKQEVERFSTDPAVRAFFITTKAGGVGLNLTAAGYVFILDPWWNPFVESQAIARAHRIGQTGKVVAVRFIARGTIEEKILQLQEKKSMLAGGFLAQPEKTAHSKEGLEFLLA